MAAEVSDRMGFENPAVSAEPVHSAPATAAAPQPGGRQLNADQGFSIGGPAQQIMGRVGNMIKGATEGRGPGSGMPGGMMPGMGGAAEGLGAIAEEAAPLAAATL